MCNGLYHKIQGIKAIKKDIWIIVFGVHPKKRGFYAQSAKAGLARFSNWLGQLLCKALDNSCPGLEETGLAGF